MVPPPWAKHLRNFYRAASGPNQKQAMKSLKEVASSQDPWECLLMLHSAFQALCIHPVGFAESLLMSGTAYEPTSLHHFAARVAATLEPRSSRRTKGQTSGKRNRR